MSIRVMSQVWDSDLPSDEKFVLLALADFADDDGRRIFPAQGRVAWKVGKGDRATRDSIGKLRDRGVIERVGMHGAGPGATVEWRIVLDALPERPPYCPAISAGQGEDCPAADDTLPGSGLPSARQSTADDPSGIHQDPPTSQSAAPAAPPALPSQGGLWGQEERDRLQVMKDLVAEQFNNRRGDRSTRDRLARLVRAGATVQQLRRAIEVAKEAPRDDALKFAVAVLARMVEEGDDGSRDAAASGDGDGGAARSPGARAGARGVSGDARGDGAGRGAQAVGTRGSSEYGSLW